MDGIIYEKEVIVCDQNKKINGKYVELFDERTFDRLFQMT